MAPTLIHERVALAREGRNPTVISKMISGWAVMGDVQTLPGYCLLLPDPVVESLNDLNATQRTAYLLDMASLGDALLAATDAYRINYEILGNTDPALHAHVIPRYLSEPNEKRRHPAFKSYVWSDGRSFDSVEDAPIMAAIREALRG